MFLFPLQKFRMGSLATDTDQVRQLTWAEVEKHSTRTDKWFVIDRGVYDISNWCKKHPGGLAVISHFAGQDATVS